MAYLASRESHAALAGRQRRKPMSGVVLEVSRRQLFAFIAHAAHKAKNRKSVAALADHLPACDHARPRSTGGEVSDQRGRDVRHGIRHEAQKHFEHEMRLVGSRRMFPRSSSGNSEPVRWHTVPASRCHRVEWVGEHPRRSRLTCAQNRWRGVVRRAKRLRSCAQSIS